MNSKIALINARIPNFKQAACPNQNILIDDHKVIGLGYLPDEKAIRFVFMILTDQSLFQIHLQLLQIQIYKKIVTIIFLELYHPNLSLKTHLSLHTKKICNLIACQLIFARQLQLAITRKIF